MNDSQPQPVPEGWDAWHQVFTLLSVDGKTPIPVSIDYVNEVMFDAIAACTNYGAQIGASFIMIILLMVLSPTLKAVKVLTAINIASLLISIIRFCMIPGYYFIIVGDFYSTFSGNRRRLSANLIRVNIAGNVLGFVQLLLIEAAFMVLTWTVVKMWRNRALRFFTFAFSALVALLALFFRFYVMVQRNVATSRRLSGTWFSWAEDGMMTSTIISIYYFWLLFSSRIALHMWQKRSLLPTMNGSNITAMDILVMTNAVLLIFPCICAGLQFTHIKYFEVRSLTHTLVVIVIPFSTIVAQHLARPQFIAFSNGVQGGAAKKESKGQSEPTMSSDNNLLSKASAATSAAVDSTSSGAGRNISSMPMAHKPRKANDPVDVELAAIDRDENDFDDAASFTSPSIKNNIRSIANTLPNKEKTPGNSSPENGSAIFVDREFSQTVESA